MTGAGLPGEQLLAALIVGASTLTAAMIRAFAYLRATRDPSSAGSETAWWPSLASVLMAVGLVAALLVLLSGRNIVSALAERFVPGFGATAGEAAVPPPFLPAGSVGGVTGEDAERLQEWLQTEGTTLYYRHDRYLGARCPGTVAVGNWADGRKSPVPVRCLQDGWLALDLGPLVRSGRMVRNVTYCVNFRSGDGEWGRHAALEAPGFDAVAVPATTIPLGRAVGFRIIRGTPADRIVLGDGYPRASC